MLLADTLERILASVYNLRCIGVECSSHNAERAQKHSLKLLGRKGKGHGNGNGKGGAGALWLKAEHHYSNALKRRAWNALRAECVRAASSSSSSGGGDGSSVGVGANAGESSPDASADMATMASATSHAAATTTMSSTYHTAPSIPHPPHRTAPHRTARLSCRRHTYMSR